VGLRKLAGLLACEPAEVVAVDPAPPSDAALPLLADPRVVHRLRAFKDDDIDGCSLVFAATGDAGENARIARLCRERGILCNCASAPDLCDFLVPAVERIPPLEATISTGGASPALAARLRRELGRWLAPRARMAELMGRIRPLVLALGEESVHNTTLFKTLAASPLEDALSGKDGDACAAILQDTLPAPLHGRIPELLHGLF
jgi:precorrin-2 dehydrogenase/sirohydrochlorin ferrochelatase